MAARDMLIIVLLALQTLFIGPAQDALAQMHYAEENGWHFDNWPDAELPWETFRNSFIGIPPTRDPYSSPLDVLFYDNLYKSELSKKGNCFGMSLMSLMMLDKEGCRGFCLPIHQYSGDCCGDAGPTDTDLRKMINQLHGHQVGLPAIQFMIDIVAIGKGRSGDYAYKQFNKYALKGDPVVVSITESLNPDDGGHTMVAYDAKDMGGGERRIYVYDPSRSWADPSERTWYTNGDNYIRIIGDSWEFVKSNGEVWSGTPSSGGHIMIIPISVIGPTPRIPTSSGDFLRPLASLFISGEDADIKQVTNSDGKRLYVPGTKEIDIDPATGMMNTVPWFPSDQDSPGDEKNHTLVLFMLDNPRGPMDIEIRNGKEGYRLGVFANRNFLSVRAQGGDGKDLITLENVRTRKPEITLRNQIGASQYDLEFHRILQPNKQSRIFRLNNLQMARDVAVVSGLSQNQRALEITTTKEGVTYDLELTEIKDRQPSILEHRRISQDKKQRQIIQPHDWKKLGEGEIRITEDPFEIPPERLQPIRR